MTQAVIKQPGEGRTIAVVGDVYRFLATGEDTNGKYALWEAIVPPGGGPPPHVHSREEEGFYILEGELEFLAGTETVRAGQGTFVMIPIGTIHTFSNPTDKPARFLNTFTPPLYLGYFEELSRLNQASVAPTRQQLAELGEIMARYDTEVVS